ncbi:MAG: NTP transferase domain-containing protein [Fibrobacteres bacterium]|nr:NTP transferase domain-containing protein [Fibrobacterota bacterium]
MIAPLDALILAGGASRRMGSDKALLEWKGRPATLRLRELLAGVVDRVWLSRAVGQELPEGWSESDVVRDREIASGPLRGILSALAAHPGRAFLVVAVDQPLLDTSMLASLVDARDPGLGATCFLDSDGSLPDPMCAIYEPSFSDSASPWLSHGKGCPRKVLLNSPVKVLSSPGIRLRDADSPQDQAEIVRWMEGRQVTLEHFALLCELAKVPSETVSTRAVDLAGLWLETADRLAIGFPMDSFRPVRNDAFAEWTDAFAAGDRISFLPPVSGG